MYQSGKASPARLRCTCRGTASSLIGWRGSAARANSVSSSSVNGASTSDWSAITGTTLGLPNHEPTGAPSVYWGGPEVSCTLACWLLPELSVHPMVTLLPGWKGSSADVSPSADVTVVPLTEVMTSPWARP